MTDQDWKAGGLNRSKYVVFKQCPSCGGTGDCQYDQPPVIQDACEDCNGRGAVEPTDSGAKYFVLRIDCGPEGPRDPHARAALYDYAYYVADDNMQFATEICEWLDQLDTGENHGD